MNVRALAGSGDRVMLAALPILAAGTILNLRYPEWFRVGGTSSPLFRVGAGLLALGLAAWLWSVALLLLNAPKGILITGGPFRIALHPLYLSVALLVLPGLGLVLDTWIGVAMGAALYLGVRLFGGLEERVLEERFGEEYRRYRRTILAPWL